VNWLLNRMHRIHIKESLGKSFGKRLPESTLRPGAKRAHWKIVQNDELRAHQQGISYESLSIGQKL